MNRDSAEHFCVFVAAAAAVALQIMRNTRHFISFFVAPSEEIKYGRGAELSSFLVDPLCCDRKWIPRTDLTELRDEFESGEGGLCNGCEALPLRATGDAFKEERGPAEAFV